MLTRSNLLQIPCTKTAQVMLSSSEETLHWACLENLQRVEAFRAVLDKVDA